MNKKIILILGVLLLLTISLNNKKIKSITMDIYNSIKGKIKYYTDSQTQRLAICANVLLKAGLPKEKLSFVLPQLALESDHFKSHVFLSDNNPSGITFINNSKRQKNAVEGQKMPKADSLTGHYAKFLTIEDWAIDYLRILNSYSSKPLQATNIQDFSKRLKMNGYYQADEKQYTKILISINKFYQPLLTII